MGDIKLQKLMRAHRKEPSDIKTHAALLREALRTNHLEENNVIASAYFKHKPSNLAVAHAVKKNGVVINGYLIYNIDGRDLLNGLDKFGHTIEFKVLKSICDITVDEIKDTITYSDGSFKLYSAQEELSKFSKRNKRRVKNILKFIPDNILWKGAKLTIPFLLGEYY